MRSIENAHVCSMRQGAAHPQVQAVVVTRCHIGTRMPLALEGGALATAEESQPDINFPAGFSRFLVLHVTNVRFQWSTYCKSISRSMKDMSRLAGDRPLQWRREWILELQTSAVGHAKSSMSADNGQTFIDTSILVYAYDRSAVEKHARGRISPE